MKHPVSLSANYRRIRADGWTPERRVTFCVNLAAGKNVTFAAASVGLSRKAAYALKKRDPDFAALWQSALSATRIMRAQGNAVEPGRSVKKPRREGNRTITRSGWPKPSATSSSPLSQKRRPIALLRKRIVAPSCQRPKTVRR